MSAGHKFSRTCFFPTGFHVNIPSGKRGSLITETKFYCNFPLGDRRYVEESFSLYEKNWEKIVSGSKTFPKNLKKIFVFALDLLKVSVADLVKFAFRVLKVLFFSRVFSFPMLRTLIYSEVLRTWFCFSTYRFACYRPGIFENFRKFYNCKKIKKLRNAIPFRNKF